MKKLNITNILYDHIKTLCDDLTRKVSKSDIFTFYGVPLLLGLILCFVPIDLPDNFIGNIIAVFSIFSALLFSAQIALYALKPDKPKKRSDQIEQRLVDEKFARHVRFLSDVNANTSYLILISCVALIYFVIIGVVGAPPSVVSGSIGVICSHFFLSLLMLIRRTHVAFKLGYELRD